MVQLWQEESVKDMETGMQGLGQVIVKWGQEGRKGDDGREGQHISTTACYNSGYNIHNRHYKF